MCPRHLWIENEEFTSAHLSIIWMIERYAEVNSDNEDLKVLVYDCLYIPWLKGDFLTEFVPEYTGSYLITLQKPSGGIHDIAPADIWRRPTGHVFVQSTQQLATKTCIDTYPNFSSWSCQKMVNLTVFTSLTQHILHIGRRRRGPLGDHEAWYFECSCLPFHQTGIGCTLRQGRTWLCKWHESRWRLWNSGPWVKGILLIFQACTHMWIYPPFLLVQRGYELPEI